MPELPSHNLPIPAQPVPDQLLPATLPVPTVPAAPETVGIPRENVQRAAKKLEKLGLDPHTFAVARHGRLVAHGAWEPYLLSDEPLVYSVSKTFTAVAIGYLVAEDKIDLAAPAWQYILPAQPVSARTSSITVAHLLAMDTGHSVEQLAQPELRPPYDPAVLFEVKPEHEPGTHFAYNSFASFQLSVIVQRLTGQRLGDFLRPRFFAPLGIGERYWARQGEFDQGYSGLHVSVHDLVSLGAAYLRWPGADVLPAGWSELSSQLHAPNGHQDQLPDNSSGYGFQVWLSQHGFRADGALGQYCLMVPDLDLVITYQGATPWPRTQEVLQTWWDEVVKPLQSASSTTTLTTTTADAAHGLPFSPHLESPITLPPVPLEEEVSAQQIVPGVHTFDPERNVLQLGEFQLPISEQWQRITLELPSAKALQVATVGRNKAGGGYEGSLIVTSSCHRLLWHTEPNSNAATVQWHTVPLRGPALAGLAVPL